MAVSQLVSWRMQASSNTVRVKNRRSRLGGGGVSTKMRGEVNSMRGSLGQAQQLNHYVRALSSSSTSERKSEIPEKIWTTTT